MKQNSQNMQRKSKKQNPPQPRRLPARNVSAFTQYGVPAGMPTTISTRVPQIVSASGGVTRVTGLEYLADMGSSNVGTFQAGSVNLNPGIVANFPWLSGMAILFSKYKYRALRLHFIPSVATSVAGNVCVSFVYDTEDAAATTMGSATACSRAVIGQAYHPFYAEPDLKHNDLNWYYVDKTVSTARTVSQVIAIIATQSSTVTSVGSLYAEYDIMFVDRIGPAMGA